MTRIYIVNSNCIFSHLNGTWDSRRQKSIKEATAFPETLQFKFAGDSNLQAPTSVMFADIFNKESKLKTKLIKDIVKSKII